MCLNNRSWNKSLHPAGGYSNISILRKIPLKFLELIGMSNIMSSYHNNIEYYLASWKSFFDLKIFDLSI